MDYSGYKHIKETPSKYETYDFLNASDALVTDYSSIMFDYAVTKRKIVLFTYDREEYKNGRGLYLDLDSLELPKADTVNDLIEELKADTKDYPEFFDKFCSYDSANTSRQVIETLLYGETKETDYFKTEKIVPSKRKKVFIFIKGMKQDHYTENLIQSINGIDLKKYDVYVGMKVNNVKNASSMLSLLKKEINYFPINYEINYTRMDYILCKLKLNMGIGPRLTNDRIKKVMRRENLKNFGDVKFDYVIHHSELDRMVGDMCLLLGESTIYNFKYFHYQKYRDSSAHRRQVKYFVKRFPAYTNVIATKEFKLLKRKADNIIYNEEAVFPMSKILSEVTQHEGRSRNIS